MAEVVIMVLCFLAGAAAFVYGVSMVSPASAWMATGILLVAAACWPIARARVGR